MLYPSSYSIPFHEGIIIMKSKSICLACSIEFVFSKDRMGKFCSRICYEKSRNKPLKKECLFCKKEFLAYSSKSRPNNGCSLSCSQKYRYEKNHQIWENLPQEQQLIKLRERFEKLVIKKEGCWDWKAAKVIGYGILKFRRKQLKAHRVSWLLYNGTIPDDLFVLHKCHKNRQCSNPDHLYLGSYLENAHDVMNFGDKKICLRVEQVLKIKELLMYGVPSTRIAKDFNIGVGAIRDIKYKKTWKHL